MNPIQQSLSQFGADKMFRHLDRLSDWQSGRWPYPVTVELDLTNACNHHCPGCSFNYLRSQSKESIPSPLAMSLLAQLSDCDVKAITFSGGGEPLVYGVDRVLRLMRLCRDLGMDAALITNGQRLTSDEFLSLCSWVRISLDAYDAATFFRSHGGSPDQFNQVVANLRRTCAAARRRRRDGLPCATVGVGFLTNERSVYESDFYEAARFASTIDGLDYLQFRPAITNGVDDPTCCGGMRKPLPKPMVDRIFDAYQEANGRFARDDFRVLLSADKYDALSQPEFGRTYNTCHGSFLQATIGADCRLYICCHGQGRNEFCLGDLRDQRFSEAWHSDRAMNVRRSINPQLLCTPACRLHPQNVVLEKMLSPATHETFI
jgi:pyruvate-formate lyase-activating enzyme